MPAVPTSNRFLVLALDQEGPESDTTPEDVGKPLPSPTTPNQQSASEQEQEGRFPRDRLRAAIIQTFQSHALNQTTPPRTRLSREDISSRLAFLQSLLGITETRFHINERGSDLFEEMRNAIGTIRYALQFADNFRRRAPEDEVLDYLRMVEERVQNILEAAREYRKQVERAFTTISPDVASTMAERRL